MATTNDLLPDSKKRTFGTELPNTSIQRRMVAPLTNATTDQATVTPSQTQIECRTSNKVVDQNDLKKRSTQNVQKFQFGPFAPTNVPENKPKASNDGTQIRDWETLAVTYSPQYQNQAVKDLFGHFMGAWNAYYSEVGGKNQYKYILNPACADNIAKSMFESQQEHSHARYSFCSSRQRRDDENLNACVYSVLL